MINITRSILFIAAGLTINMVNPAQAQIAPTTPATPAPFVAVPAAEAPQYHFDFAKNFYPNDAAYQQAYARLLALAAKIETYRGKVIASPTNLFNVLKLDDEFTNLYIKPYQYLGLKYATNTKDTSSRDAQAKMDSEINPRTNFIITEIQQITPAQLSLFMTEYPRLKNYEYEIYQTIRQKPYTLSDKEETLLGEISPLTSSWQSDEYHQLMDRALWGTVVDPTSGNLDVRQDEGKIGNSSDQAVRKEGFDKENAAYKSERDLFAFDVIHVAKAQNKLAQIHHFKNGQDAAFFALFLSYPDVQNAFTQILTHGDLNKKSQTLRRNRIATFTGYDTVHSWDMTVVPPGVIKPRFTIDEATAAIKSSTQYLGPEWNSQLDSLLDPTNGRLDIVGAPNRVPNAFTIDAPGFKSMFYSYAYEGYLQDVVTLAHESGHVVHMALMNDNHVPSTYFYGPNYFTESYAILDEYVLDDTLYGKETDSGRKVYYLESLLRELMGLYGTTGIAAYEKAMYEGVDNGTITNADDLDSLQYKNGSQWSIWFDIDPESKNLWQQVPHYYEAPTYYVNYVFATLLAQTYFAMYKQDPIGFGKKFTALERNGFNDTPDHLLKKFLDIDLSDPKTYDGVFTQQQKYLDDLTALYQQVPVPPANPVVPAVPMTNTPPMATN